MAIGAGMFFLFQQQITSKKYEYTKLDNPRKRDLSAADAEGHYYSDQPVYPRRKWYDRDKRSF